MREMRHVALVAVEQAVEAHRSVVMRGAGERAEAVAGVEARFAHGAIARVEVAREPVAAVRIRVPGARAQQAGVNVAIGLLEACRFCRIGVLRAFDEKCCALGAGMLDERANHVAVVGVGVGHFGHRACAVIEVAGETGMAGQVFRPRPRGVVLLRDGVGVLQPVDSLRAAGGSRGKTGRVLEHEADHRGEKRRLRAGEIVGAIGVENGAVVLHFEEEVVDDALGERFSVLGFQSQNNKKTVPAVHFVEAATGNDVGVRQIEQARCGELLGAHIAQLENVSRQRDDADMAALGGGNDLLRRGKTGGQIEN